MPWRTRHLWTFVITPCILTTSTNALVSLNQHPYAVRVTKIAYSTVDLTYGQALPPRDVEPLSGSLLPSDGGSSITSTGFSSTTATNTSTTSTTSSSSSSSSLYPDSNNPSAPGSGVSSSVSSSDSITGSSSILDSQTNAPSSTLTGSTSTSTSNGTDTFSKSHPGVTEPPYVPSSIFPSLNLTASNSSNTAFSNASVPSNSSTGLCPQLSSFNYTPPSIAPTGSGADYAVSCYSEVINYYNALAEWHSTVYDRPIVPESTTSLVATLNQTVTSAVVPSSLLFQTCDDYPRIQDNATLVSTTKTVSVTWALTITQSTDQGPMTPKPGCPTGTSGMLADPPVKSPECAFPPGDCPAIPDSLLASSSLDPRFRCMQLTASEYSTCTVVASSVQLYYWPITTTGEPSCGSNGLTWATVAPPNGTRVATINLDSGHAIAGSNGTLNGTSNGTSNNTLVMTSPWVYMAIAGISATKFMNYAFQTGVGSVGQSTDGHVGSQSVATTIISQHPTDLQSVEQHISGFSGPWQSEVSMIVSADPHSYTQYYNNLTGWNYTDIQRSYNLLNLQRPVPASDYFFRQVDRDIGTRDSNGVQSTNTELTFFSLLGTTISDDYRAYIPVPSQIRAMDPAWADCILALDGIYDPPIPITSATFASATPPGPTIRPTATAVPPPSVPPPTAISTQPPQTQAPVVPAPAPGSTNAQAPINSCAFGLCPSTNNNPPPPVSADPGGSTQQAQPAPAPAPAPASASAPGANQPAPPAQPAQPAPQPAQPAQPAPQPAQPAQPAPQLAQPIPQPAQPAQAGQPGQPAQPAQPAQAGQPGQSAQPAQPAQPAQASQPGQPAQPAQPAQQAQPGGQGNPAVPAAAPGQTQQAGNPPAPPQAVVPIGNNAPPITASQVAVTLPNGAVRSDAVVLPSATLLPGSDPATIGGQVISANPGGAINVGGSINVPLVAPPSAVPLNNGVNQGPIVGAVVNPDPGGGPSFTAIAAVGPGGQQGVNVGGTFIPQGGAPATVGGAVISVGNNGQVIAGPNVPGAAPVTQALSTLAPGSQAPVVGAVLGGSQGGAPPVTAIASTLPNGQLGAVVAGQTAVVGGPPVTAGGSVIHLNENGQIVASASTPGAQPVTQALSTLNSGSTGAIITNPSGSPITAIATTGANGLPAVLIGSQTVQQGSDPVTVGDKVFSVGPGNQLVQSGTAPGSRATTVPLSYLGQNLQQYPSSFSGAVVTGSNGQAITAAEQILPNGHTGIVVSGKTAERGGAPITVGDTVLSLAPDGKLVASGTKPGAQATTVPLSGITTTKVNDPSAESLVHGATTSAITGKDGKATPVAVLPGSMTLTAGGQALIKDGKVVSLASDGKSLIIDGKTTETWDGIGFGLASATGGVFGAFGGMMGSGLSSLFHGAVPATLTGASYGNTAPSGPVTGQGNGGSLVAPTRASVAPTGYEGQQNAAAKNPGLMGAWWGALFIVVMLAIL